MANLISNVDRTIGNYEDVFIYSINVGFSGIVGNIDSAQIKIFFPENLNLFLGDTKEPVKEVIQNPVVGGTEVVYDFGAITDLGIATRLGLGVTFKLETENLTAFAMNPKLYINGEEIISSDSEVITLTVIPRFEISREIILPSIEPAPDSEIYYKLTLENFGDLGAILNNSTITCFGSDDIEIDNTFAVVGKDASSKFEDKSLDGMNGTFNGNAVIFNLSSYRGQRYEFIYKARISQSTEIGEELTTNASFIADDTEEQIEVHDIEISAPIYDANISLYSPDYTLPDEYICYRMNIGNVGNQILYAASFKNELPAEVKFYKFSTGAFHINALSENLSAEYSILYETENGASGTFGTFNTDDNNDIILSNFIADDDRLSALYWNLTALGVGVTDRIAPSLFGIVDSDVALASDILDHMHLTYTDLEGAEYEEFQNATTIVDNICLLQPSLSTSVSTAPIRPNQIFRYTLYVDCISSRLLNPIMAILLPKELEYVGNESFVFSDVFTDISPVMPTPVVIPNFTEIGETLVKYQFDDEFSFSFRQLAKFSISFDAKVAVGAYGEIESAMLLNTVGSTGRIPNTYDVYNDPDNIAQDVTVDTKYCVSNVIKNRILFFVSTSSNKKVKGALDTEFIEEPQVGKTYEAGRLDYKITVKNIGNADLTKVEIVDILPYVGDTAVIAPTIGRGSQFNVYSLSEVEAKILPEDEEVEFDIYYSTSTDPVRFGPNFDIIGTDDNWTEIVPDDITTLRAFKVSPKNVTLKPNDILQVDVIATVPVGVSTDEVAWNSFAADVSYLDINNVEQHLLAIEPEKVGISINETPVGTVEIGGFVWLDSVYDGIYTEDEDLVNDVGVMLLDEEMNIVGAVFTTPDASGKKGQYLFKNLQPQQYYVKFFIDDVNFKFTKRRTDVENGNLADSSSGMTPIIDMRTSLSNRNIVAGIILKSTRTIDELLKVNNSARAMMRDVVKSQMLLVMKEEDIMELIENSENN